MLRRLVPSAYRPVLANRVFRRLILGFAVGAVACVLLLVRRKRNR